MDEKLAIEYFNNQQYEKALVKFNTVYKKNPTVYYRYILDCYLELDQLTNAENFISKSIKKSPNNAPTYYIDLGYVQLKNGKESAAEKSFSKVFQFVEERPNMAYGISTAFSKYGFYAEALETFERAESINPGLSFDYQKALVYADMGDSKNMYISYLSMLDKNASYYNSILSMLRQSVNPDPTSESNIMLKELIVEKIQTTGNPLFNDLLVWVLIQEKSFSSAYIQLKALDKRLNRNQSEMYNLGGLAVSSKDYSSAEKCFDYIIKVGEISQAFGGKEMVFHLGLVAFGILYSPIGTILSILMNINSRKNEFEADHYAKTTYSGAALELALKKLSADSLSNLYPHPFYTFIHYSHPPLLKRLSALND